MAAGAGVRPRRLVGDAGKWGNGDEGMCTDKDSGRRWGRMLFDRGFPWVGLEEYVERGERSRR